MSRIFLIARREYAAYAKTVGFWLSLLAFPLFAVLGGGVQVLIKSSEPVREVALVESGPQATGLAAAVRQVLQDDADRRAARQREEIEKAMKASGAPPGAANQALAGLGGNRLRFVDTPADIAAAAPGPARDDAVRRHLEKEADQRLAAVVFLDRNGEAPTARVWTARATDDTVEDFIRDALKSINRKAVFAASGIDTAIVDRTETFRPEISVFSPNSRSGGEVSFRDKLPMLVGLAGGFILWSLILTGASILLNSVMEEKSNKILEVLLSSASATEILTGKVLGVAMLTLSVLAVWGVLGLGGLARFAPDQAADIMGVLWSGGMLGWFLAFMVGGYLMYAVLFAAIGAFCETPRDAQTLMGPIMMILVVPMLTLSMALQTPDAPVVKILSWIPLFTPFLMMARMPSDPPLIESIGALVTMFAFAGLMVWVAGRAFRAGALSDVKLSWKSFAAAIRGGGR
ncbi:MAG: ABC transporter permease [Brevundimonas sp.]|uniref:ABC transporter permease n=1 Tax=Brevundimonas sp. TaxID=1871086 RepID=UPI004033E27E